MKSVNPIWKAAAATLCLGVAAGTILRLKRRISLEGRVVIITGASSGHGLILAKEAAKQGALLVIAARTESDLASAEHELRRMGARKVLAVPTDVRDYMQVKRLIYRAIEVFGRIDILVNNAGIMGVGPEAEMSLEDFEDHLTTNFWGPLYAIVEALPHMKRRGFGRIANIVSIGGKTAVPHMLPYTVSKFALAGLSRGLRAELAEHNILMTGIYPSPMRTGGHTHAWFKGNRLAEYRWFGSVSNLPLVSSSAEYVARRVWRAIRDGLPEAEVGMPARIAAILQTAAPNLTAEALALFNRALPSDLKGEDTAIRGEQLSGPVADLLKNLVPDGARVH